MKALAKKLSRSDVKTRFLWLPQSIDARRILPALDELSANPRIEIELLDENGKPWRFRYGAYTRTVIGEITQRFYLRDQGGFLFSKRARVGSYLELRLDAGERLRVSYSRVLSFACQDRGPWRLDEGDVRQQ